VNVGNFWIPNRGIKGMITAREGVTEMDELSDSYAKLRGVYAKLRGVYAKL